MFSSLVERFSQNPKTLFLVDGLGAMLSMFFLSFVLTRLESLVGMPIAVLHLLGTGACLLSLTSLTCARFLPTNWRPFLLTIAAANLTYCGVTIALLVHHSSVLRPLGWLYFLGEIAIIVSLATLEITVARRRHL